MEKKHIYEQVKVSDLKDYERNARTHSEKQIKQVAESIKQFGFTNPVLIDKDNVIIAGHGRAAAAKLLGLETVPAIRVNGLSETEIKALRIADNQLALNSGWDEELLAAELNDIRLDDFDLDVIGFDDDFLNGLLNDDEDNVTDNGKAEAIPEKPKALRVKKGDVWILGEHRLCCGDSTNKEDVERLMNGERAEITFSSPPYNMARSDTKACKNPSMHGGQAYNEYTDDLTDEDYTKLLNGILKNALEVSDDVLLNIGILTGSKIGIIEMMHEFRKNFCDILIWKKENSIPLALPPQYGNVSHRCELIFCFNQNGSRKFTHPTWKPGTQTNLIETENNSGNKYGKIHSAAFPVTFANEVVCNYAKESVLDLFGGTGTTLISCEQNKRKCFMMELDPVYCDIILDRWEELTGKKAHKEKK